MHAALPALVEKEIDEEASLEGGRGHRGTKDPSRWRSLDVQARPGDSDVAGELRSTARTATTGRTPRSRDLGRGPRRRRCRRSAAFRTGTCCPTVAPRKGPGRAMGIRTHENPCRKHRRARVAAGGAPRSDFNPGSATGCSTGGAPRQGCKSRWGSPRRWDGPTAHFRTKFPLSIDPSSVVITRPAQFGEPKAHDRPLPPATADSMISRAPRAARLAGRRPQDA
jgi:hypothetical protein